MAGESPGKYPALQFNMTKESYLILIVALAIITLGDVAFMWNMSTHLHLNGTEYVLAGLAQSEDQGNTLYFPVYKLKGDKK